MRKTMMNTIMNITMKMIMKPPALLWNSGNLSLFHIDDADAAYNDDDDNDHEDDNEDDNIDNEIKPTGDRGRCL